MTTDPIKLRESKRRYRAKHPDKVRAMKQRYYAKYRSRLLAKSKARYLENPVSYYAKVREWKKNNPEKEKAYQEKWSEKNREQIASRMKGYNSRRYADNPDLFKARAISWYQRNKEKLRVKRKSVTVHRAAMLRQYANQRLQSIALGSEPKSESQVVELIVALRSGKDTKCFYCGKSLFGNPIHIDHMVPISKGGKHEASNLCASCPACNLSKNDKTIEEWTRWKLTVNKLVIQH